MSKVCGHMPSGAPVRKICLKGGGLTANILTYGAVLQDLRLAGHETPLVLGFREFAPYLTHSPYFGATVGRFANRIRDGHLDLDGRSHQLDTNFIGKHTLHGGVDGMGQTLWRIEAVAADRVTLAITLPDGHMGFPGKLEVQVQFALLECGILDIIMRATSDAATLCNLAHHSYFRLDSAESVSDHLLQIAAKSYLPVDAEMIPTGEVRAVERSEFDFCDPASVSQAHTLDHNFCLAQAREKLRPVAWLSSPKSGLKMECRTTEAGLQVYNAAHLDGTLQGQDGRPMGVYAGLAIEPQNWPDAHHHAHFPQAILRPDEIYEQHTQFVFSKGEVQTD